MIAKIAIIAGNTWKRARMGMSREGNTSSGAVQKAPAKVLPFSRTVYQTFSKILAILAILAFVAIMAMPAQAHPQLCEAIADRLLLVHTDNQSGHKHN